MSGNGPMIEAEGLTKYYGSFAAVNDVSFKVNAGEIVAFLGPNGAGKSTTMKILTGYLTPTSGSARIAGLDVSTHRLQAAKQIGYLPENGPLYPDLTPRELLSFFGQARGMKSSEFSNRLSEVSETCHIKDVLEKPIDKLSKGYKQRVGMAHVLLHEPQVIIMDEPTSGLDPNQIADVRKAIRQLGETKTVLLSTHILQEVDAMADRVVMINEGRVVFDGTPDQLRNEGNGNLESAFHKMTGAA